MDALKLEGLQPADGQPVAALFNQRTGDRKHLCGLSRRADAVLLPANEPA
jgi:hypothetical protein